MATSAEGKIFQLLLNKLEDIARQRDIPRSKLDVWSENTAAKQAFSRCGFQTYNEKMKLALDGPDPGPDPGKYLA